MVRGEGATGAEAKEAAAPQGVVRVAAVTVEDWEEEGTESAIAAVTAGQRVESTAAAAMEKVAA